MQSNFIHLILIIIGFSSFEVNFNKKLPQIKNKNISKILLYTPLILLPLFNHRMLDHIFTSYSFVIMMNKIAQLSLDKYNIDKIFPLSLLILLISFNYSILPRNSYVLFSIYIYKLILSYSLYSLKKDTTFAIFNNIFLSHLLFFICKF